MAELACDRISEAQNLRDHDQAPGNQITEPGGARKEREEQNAETPYCVQEEAGGARESTQEEDSQEHAEGKHVTTSSKCESHKHGKHVTRSSKCESARVISMANHVIYL